MPNLPSLWLELTPFCNLDCQFCYNPWRPGDKREYPRMLGYSEYREQVLRLVERIDFSYVTLSGGEPTLYRQLNDLVGVLAERRQHTILTTNGTLVDRARLQALRASGLSGVQVPILAVTPSIHDELSRKRCWRESISTFTLTLELGLQAIVVFVNTAKNMAELPAVVELVAALGGRHLIVSELQPVGSAAGNAHDLAVTREAFTAAGRRAREVAAEAGVSLKVVRHAYSLPESNLRGTELWPRWTVSPAGELKLCNFSVKHIGNLTTMTDAELDRLIGSYLHGGLADLAAAVDNCACLAAAVGGPDRA